MATPVPFKLGGPTIAVAETDIAPQAQSGSKAGRQARTEAGAAYLVEGG